jgi:hypothetical protein
MANKPVEDTVKPSNDAYTGMLAISLIALLIGGALLYLVLSQYDFKKDPPKQPALSAPAKGDATASPSVSPSPTPSPSPVPTKPTS